MKGLKFKNIILLLSISLLFSCVYATKECPKGSHSYETIETVSAKCTKAGYRKYKCKTCNKISQKTLKKVDHDYKYIKSVGTCNKNGYKKYKCKNCDKISKKYYKPGHSYKYIKETVSKDTSKTTFKCRKCNHTKVQKFKIKKSNYYSTLRISDVNLKVKTYKGFAQSIVDRTDSAACFEALGKEIIADHKNQGFDKIKKCKVGNIATFNSKRYECIKIIKNGHNLTTDLTDENYVSIEKYKGDLAMYTCNDHWKNITITLWKEL